MSWIVMQMNNPSSPLSPAYHARCRRAKRDEEFERTVAQLREEERLRHIRRETQARASWFRRWFK